MLGRGTLFIDTFVQCCRLSLDWLLEFAPYHERRSNTLAPVYTLLPPPLDLPTE